MTSDHGPRPSPQDAKVPGRVTFFKNYFIVVQLQLSAFFPHSSTPPQPNPPPSPASTLPLGFVYVSFIVVPENPRSGDIFVIIERQVFVLFSFLSFFLNLDFPLCLPQKLFIHMLIKPSLPYPTLTEP